MTVTIKDVARLSGVSISTVSRVMNSPDIVSPGTKERVEQAIQQLGYSPNALARGLISKETHTVGVLIPDISNYYASEIVKGLEDAGHEAGMSLILCNTNRDPERMIHYFNVLKQKQVDGVVFTSELFTKEYYELIAHTKIPIVLASTKSLDDNIPTVKINDEQAGFDAVEYLVAKGHTNIGMISGPRDDLIAGLPRFLGFERAHRELLGILDADERVEFSSFRFEGGYYAMKRLYLKRPAITAVFCASDEMALGAMSYLDEIGIRVPADISILGFDNTKIAKMSIPKLTTVAQPMYEIGRIALGKLNTIKEGKKLDEIYTCMPHSIVERGSVADLKERKTARLEA